MQTCKVEVHKFLGKYQYCRTLEMAGPGRVVPVALSAEPDKLEQGDRYGEEVILELEFSSALIWFRMSDKASSNPNN